MKVVIKENTWFTRGMFDFGWGNGYVLIPENHPLHGKHYNDIDVDVHGGLTFSELVNAEMVESWGLDKQDEGKWCVGFDTAHYADNLFKWSKEKVQEEAERLKEQLLSYR
jgi:hypothetical protein